MKAVRIHEYGGEKSFVLEDAPQPVPAADEVLIKVHAAGVNPVDTKIRQGFLKDFLPLKLPAIIGCDVAGVIEAVGDDVTEFAIGDEVYAMVGNDMGAYAEFAAAKSSAVARKPRSINFDKAAAVPLAALSAWQSLFDLGDLQAGQTVLIHAAAGGVGTFAVQFAKIAGANVIATASANNHDFLKKLGADTVIDYTAERFEEVVRDADLVVDAVGGETFTRSLNVLKRGGILVALNKEEVKPEIAESRGITVKTLFAQTSSAQLSRIADLIDAGKVKVVLDSVVPFSAAAEAHRKIQTKHTRGKIILEIAPNA